ncbi:MAG: hypothetical protein JWQ87_4391 [Candidatus Sulfotelmatobacter sp.]|nr:hypothetical protein [Candidatus Sulfotelmatobacter sp.]
MDRRRLPVLIVVAAFLIGVAAKAGSFLVVDAPRSSDVILVLAGEMNHRPERALQLLAQGFGQRIVLDVPTTARIYQFTQIELAQKYIQDLPQAAAVSICPIYGLSTRDEARDVAKCLIREGASERVLIVTSDFHTRRALSVFRREIAGREFAVAASRDEEQFGVRWWTHRQWAKMIIDEWMRLIWWESVDRWR